MYDRGVPVRKLLLVAGTVTAMSVLVACGSSGGSSGSSSGGAAASPLIGSDYPRSDTDFWNAYIRYTPIQARSLGITNLKTTNSENDIAKLAANVQTLITQGVKGVVM